MNWAAFGWCWGITALVILFILWSWELEEYGTWTYKEYHRTQMYRIIIESVVLITGLSLIIGLKN